MAAEWQPPIPLDAGERPQFPVETLPPVLRDYARDLAEVYQVPVDLPAVLMLPTVGSTLAQRVIIEAGPSWTEPTNLYVACALPPASRKSATFGAVTAPLRAIERDEVKHAGADIERLTQEREIQQRALDEIKKRAAKAPPEEREILLQEAEQLRQQLPRIPTSPRLLADDVSPERLVTLLGQNHGRIALMSAEGGVFDMMGGRYSNGAPNLDVYLKAHAGDAIYVDRVNRPSDYVEAPTLSMGLAVQPDVLRGLADKPGFRGRGLVGRFLYSLPPSNIGRRETDTGPVNLGIQSRYEGLINTLFEFGRLSPDQGPPEALRVTLSREASASFRAYCARHETSLAAGEKLEFVTDWAGKLPGAVIRIAGILHAAKHRATLANEAIDAETIGAAIQIGDYFTAHALAVFELMGADPAIEDARSVLGLLKRREWEQFRARDVHQALRGRFKRPQDIQPALEILEERGYIQQANEPPQTGPGRKPSQAYIVNPYCLTQNTQITQNVVSL